MHTIKKLLAVIVCLSILTLLFAVPSIAADISVKINNNPISFDVNPIIINNRTMVPLRAIFEALGAKVSWDEEKKTIYAFKDNNIIVLQVDNEMAFVNGVERKLDAPPQIINGRTIVPTRFIAEALNAKVDFDESTSTVLINLSSQTTFSTISPEDAQKKLETKIIFIDVRTQEEYNEGHIKNSILIPYDTIKEKISQFVADKNAEIIVYCRSGARSKIAAEGLSSMGYTNVLNLGGINNWQYELVK